MRFLGVVTVITPKFARETIISKTSKSSLGSFSSTITWRDIRHWNCLSQSIVCLCSIGNKFPTMCLNPLCVLKWRTHIGPNKLLISSSVSLIFSNSTTLHASSASAIATAPQTVLQKYSTYDRHLCFVKKPSWSQSLTQNLSLDSGQKIPSVFGKFSTTFVWPSKKKNCWKSSENFRQPLCDLWTSFKEWLEIFRKFSTTFILPSDKFWRIAREFLGVYKTFWELSRSLRNSKKLPGKLCWNSISYFDVQAWHWFQWQCQLIKWNFPQKIAFLQFPWYLVTITTKQTESSNRTRNLFNIISHFHMYNTQAYT